MKKMIFKCKLLSDIIINQKAATEGNQETLDFIPGSNFLGIVAGALYFDENDKNNTERLSPEDSLIVFHGKEVRFGDAHPAILTESEKWIRCLRIPAAMFYPKLKKVTEECYIHHVYDRGKDTNKMQLKQCRSGFYAFDEKKKQAIPADIDKSFAIKSAYDRDMRRSADEQMYGYESLQAGSTWLFEVTVDVDNVEWCDKIKNALTGKRRVGRSRTAQYGLVEIGHVETKDIDKQKKSSACDCIVIYADSRLIFLDKKGNPTFRPNVEADLKITGGKINWSKSQIRTFEYAPWNFRRQTRDADRCGIEKGSVIIVEKDKDAAELTYQPQEFFGKYQSEGFGKIIYNPDFLEADQVTGLASYKILENQKSKSRFSPVEITEETKGSVVYQYLLMKSGQEKQETKVYASVNEFVKNNKSLFEGERFASQWGNIRKLAIQNSDNIDTMFSEIRMYLTKGVAKDKWSERNRFKNFDEYLNNIQRRFENKYAPLAIVNVAAEMAKESRR